MHREHYRFLIMDNIERHSKVWGQFDEYVLSIEEVDGRDCAYITNSDTGDSASFECAYHEGELTTGEGYPVPFFQSELRWNQMETWLSEQGYYS